MLIRFDGSGLRQTRWYEYASRFLFGGLITAITGAIAHRFGPVIAGLFLAFPAIFPASASLIEKHQIQKMQQAGLDGTASGRKLAGVDAAGTALGTAGLVVFALIVWRGAAHSPWLALLVATACWAITAVIAWFIRKRGLRIMKSWLLRSSKPIS